MGASGGLMKAAGSLCREDKKTREERKACLRWDGFPDLRGKDPGIYKAERERMGLKKKKEGQTGKRDNRQRQLAHTVEH